MQEPLTTRLKKVTLEQFKEKKHACYVAAKGKILNTDQITDLKTLVTSFINHPEQRTALLLGDSGAGKTLFGQCLVRHLWGVFEVAISNRRVPLWINLAAIENPQSNLLDKHLKQLGFKKEERAELKQNSTFFLVLDAADEINCDQNLYEANGFAKNDIKLLTTFRSSALQVNQVTRRLFGPNAGALLEYEIQPFDVDQSRQCMQLYLRYHKLPWTPEVFGDRIKKLIDVAELITNPYYLYLTLKILPALILKHANEQSPVKRLTLTRQDLYAAFVEQRFKRQQEKLDRARGREVHALLERKNRDRAQDSQLTLIDLFREYCQKLAYAMHMRGLKQVTYNPQAEIRIVSQQEIVLVGSVSPAAINNSRPKELDESAWLKEFFDDQHDPDLAIIRSACPIRQIKVGQWTFFHASLLDYFVADHLFNSAILEVQVLTGHNLNSGNLQEVPDILKFLVDRAKIDQEFVAALFKIIDLSKHEPQVWKAAANAITILNYAGIILTNKNFRRSRIGGVDEITHTGWGADLSHSHLFGSDMREADCRYIKLRLSNLGAVKLNDACLTGVNFGMKSISSGGLYGLSNDGTMAIVFNKYYKIVNTSTGEIIRDYKYYDQYYGDMKIIFSPNGKQIALIYDGGSRLELSNLDNQPGIYLKLLRLKSAIFSADSKYFITSSDNTLILINTIIMKVDRQLKLNLFDVEYMFLTPDQSYLIAGELGSFSVIRLSDGSHKTYHTTQNRDFSCEIIASRLITVRNQLILVSLECPRSYEAINENHPDLIIANINKNTVRKIKVKSLKKVVHCFSPDSTQLFILTKHRIVVWDVVAGNVLRYAELEEPIFEDTKPLLACSPCGRQLAIVTSKGIVGLWDVATLTCTKILFHYVRQIIFHPLMPLLFVETEMKYDSSGSLSTPIIYAVELSYFQEEYLFKKRPHYLGGNLISSTDGRYIIGLRRIDSDRRLKFGDPKYGDLSILIYDVKKNFLKQINSMRAFGVFCSPDNKTLAILTGKGSISIKSIKNFRSINEISLSNQNPAETIMSLIYRYDSLQIAFLQKVRVDKINETTKIYYVVKLWDISAAKPVNVYEGTKDEIIHSITYNKNGSQLLISTSHNKILVLNVQTRSLQHSFTMFDVLYLNIIYLSYHPIESNQILILRKIQKFTSDCYHFGVINLSTGICTVLSDPIQNFYSNNIVMMHSLKPHPLGQFLAVTVVCEGSKKKSLHTWIGIWNVANKKWHTKISVNSCDYHWVDNELILRISDIYSIQSIWKISSESDQVTLTWCSHPSYDQNTANLDISNCHGFDAENLQLLRPIDDQAGHLAIIGKPCTLRNIKDVLEERRRQIYIKDGILRFRDSSGKDFKIDSNYWVVSLVRKRQTLQNSSSPIAKYSAHVSLIIQGVTEDHYSYVKEIHLFLDLNKTTYFSQSIGTGLVQIRYKSPQDLESQVQTNEYLAKSWNLNKEVVMQLLTNIESDQQQKIDYIVSGYSPGLFSRPAYSCLTWCEHHLQKIGLDVSGEYKDLFCAFPTQHLPDPNQPKESCGLM